MSIARRAHEWISRHVGWPLFRAVHPVARAGGRLERECLEWFTLSQAEADARQLRDLRGLLADAGRFVPYYRRLFEKVRFDPSGVEHADALHALPVLERETVQRDVRELCTERTDIRLYMNSSGGSSGAPVVVYQTRESRGMVGASGRAANGLAGYRLGKQKAFLWGSPSDAAGARGLAYRVLNWMRNERLFDAYDMGPDEMQRFHHALMRCPPTILVCYASSLHTFARFLAERGLEPNYPTRGVISSAELLTPSMRAEIEPVFDAPLFNRYGSRECGTIAMQCERLEGMHVVGCNVLVDTVDPDTDEPVRDRPGDVVITTLRNRGMPLIRYRIGDQAILSSDASCPCGRPGPIIKEVLGRRYQSIRLPDGRVVHGSYFTHLFWRVPGLREFRFIQDAPDRFRLLLVVDERYDPEEDERLRDKVYGLTGRDAEVAVEHVDALEPLASGKRQFIVCNLPDAKAPEPRGADGS